MNNRKEQLIRGIVAYRGIVWKMRPRRRPDDDETWDALLWVHRDELAGFGITSFALKNYGGPPGDGFRGWKVVSAGPYDIAGSWSTFEDAVPEATKFIVDRWTAEIQLLISTYEDRLRVLSSFKQFLL